MFDLAEHGWSVADLNDKNNEEEFAFMQYTGLKDKNGKEIYEGDIVEHLIGGTLEVKWLNHGWTPFMSWHDVEHYEIIGNIYENPELLA